ncbi:hypothetical protein T439DRAFT_204143 [Meredithblackwellia eburnea MCA 4105]
MSKSEGQWLADLKSLLDHAKQRFSDVSWIASDGTTLIHAHKSIVFARSSGIFQQRYLLTNSQGDGNESTLSLPFRGSRRSVTPNGGRDYTDVSQFVRSPSPASIATFASSAPAAPLPLAGTDPAMFRACLEHFYSGSEGEVTVLFEGFDGLREGEPELKGIDKLRSDCLFMWRSRLYGDMSIVLEDAQSSTFSAHRSFLASRSPYFRSLLLGSFADSTQTQFKLPSPPFTAASTLFVLGYIYSGTLDFGNRTFDLTTSFEIWRCGAYLQLSLLQEDVEAKIEKMLNNSRAARVYAFAHAPDVGSLRLARLAAPILINKFGETWLCKEIGNLEYETQKKLVSSVCASISATSLATVAKSAFLLRRRLELERSSWASHIRSMLDAIDERLKSQLGRALPEVVASPAFVELIDGIGFSSDVLEYLLEMVVETLSEAKAPEAYQTLVGSVLLREDGCLMDARVLVEDAKSGILKYIKKRWNGIKLAGGFDRLESWALKELADEIELRPEDLISQRGATSRSPVARPAVRKSVATSSTPHQTTAPNITPRVSSAPSAAVRAPRASTSATVSATSASTRVALRTQRSAPPRSQAPGLRQTSNGTGSSSRTMAPVQTTSVPPAPTSSTSRSPSRLSHVPQPQIASTTSPPKPSRAPPPLPPPGPSSLAASTSTSTSQTPSQVNGSTPAPATPPTSGPASSLASSSKGTPRTPSLSSSSTGTTRTSITKRPRALSASRASMASSTDSPPVPGSSTTKPRASAPSRSATPSRAATPSRTPTTPKFSASDKGKSTVPLREKEKSTNGGSDASPSASAAPQSKTPPSTSGSTVPKRATTTSMASTKTSTIDGVRRPVSSTSLRSVASVRAPTTNATPIRRPSSTTSLKSTTSTTKRSNTAPINAKASGIVVGIEGGEENVPPPLPVPKPSALKGTTLLSGIPCIATVAVDKPTRFKASVRYIGTLQGKSGQWIGIEVAESAIPPEARDLAWNDGKDDETQYFELTNHKKSNNGRSTPQPDRPDGNSGSSGSSLRPPSRRARRSSSSDGGEPGPRKGLFVRPNQIVYVL